MSAGGGAKAIIAAFFANMGIAVAKFLGFLITGSSSMLAESVHSVADSGNQGLLLLGRKRARRVADEAHPFGYGRERFFWSFVVALVLFTLGSLFAIYEGVHKVGHPEPIRSAPVAITILLVAVGLESFSLRTAMTEARELRRGQGLLRFVRTSKNPELPVVVLEDIGALAGLMIALVALLLAWKVDPVFDGYGTIIIGLLLGVIAVLLAVEMKSLLIGESASVEDVAGIRTAIESSPRVTRVIHMRTEHVGPEEILVAAKLAFVADIDLDDLAEAIDDVEARIRAAVPAAQLIYIEPDLYRDDPGHQS